ncbi:MAG TPA: putative toxin-antitoxin system toxin component, PIN family [Microscillaceae bacterium]|jgi:putative PIN family toxin of toxin-antitoxin system|nr:putative toxin-antitoxin system toxin component, PIN family [Microscillaceae bacterium]
MKVVIDTHCLLASIPPKSTHYWLYQAFERCAFEWALSNEIMSEYEEKLAEKYSQSTADLVLNILSIAPNTIFAEPFYRWQLIVQDADDNKFVDLAISIGADYLITNDKHFNILKSIDFPKVSVVSLEEFKEMIAV